MADVFDGLLLRVVIAYIALYVAATFIWQPPILILIENGLLLSVSGGVAAAYLPVVGSALRARHPERGHLLGLGIFLTWISGFAIQVMSIVARDLGNPEVLNTHWRTVAVAPMLLGGILHLWAPNAVDGRIPRERWVIVGSLVGVAIFVIFGLWTLHEAGSQIPHPLMRFK